uniref:Uncharacterized protein n=1 Tax=Cajanus cajan TaxID=3821 RepID=A0A151U5C4_CAJCA|nr:hypothetical protein KK1_007206 [Cajanus cajan]
MLDYRALESGDPSQAKTIKFDGELKGYPILLLVDSGATHNFVARELVASLNLVITPTDSFCVGLGNGSKCYSQGLCRAIRVKVGHYFLSVDAYVLDLGGVAIKLIYV